MELDRRKKALLGVVVDAYVARAEPVGSEWIAAAGNLGVRSATIRNELAEMTDLGYLRQPHTSAGRIPSTLGYRYYVDHLMASVRLPAPDTRPLLSIERYTEGDVEQLLVQTCRMLSDLTHYTAVAAPPTAGEVRVRSIHLAQMGDSQVLLVGVLESGRIIHRFVELPAPVTPSEVTRLSNGLHEMLRGAAPSGFAAAQVPAGLAAQEETLRLLAGVLQRGLGEESGDVFLQGASHMLEQPEFRAADRVEPLIRLLEERRSAYEQLRDLLAERSLAVVIGEENPHAAFQECSVVMARYRAGGMTGWVGVVGPTRMCYPRAVPAVRLAARALGEAFSRIGLA